MGSTPTDTPVTAGPPLVPVAWAGRTSTAELQDPASSLARQLRVSTAKLPPGFRIVAWFWDVESGGLDIEDRGRAATWQQVDTNIPRDGGLAALLAEARAPEPRFAAVICEDIERTGRDTFNALKLERELSDQGIPLFASDEPISLEGMNATTVLIRRVKQSVAEWYRLQLKEKTREGSRQHSLDGWHVGRTPYGYLAERHAHPNPMLAAQGRTRTRLALDPALAPVVEQIFAWRVTGHLGVPEIVHRLNADPDAYPLPGGWTAFRVYRILGNPKYTGHMVYGRSGKPKGGKKPRKLPRDQWLWTPQPCHAAIVDRDTWEAAQTEAAAHSTSPDDYGPTPRARRTYILRSRVRCRACNRRMSGLARSGAAGAPPLIYYTCPHRPDNPRHAATCPDHPAGASIREDRLLAAIWQGFDERVFGPDRAKLLAAATPATAAARAARKDKDTTRLRKRLRVIDAFEDAHTAELEALITATATPAAITALRTRHIKRFTELETERAAINDQLTQLTAPDPDTPGNPDLLNTLPVLAGLLTDAPQRLQQQIYDAFNLQALHHAKDHQVTIRATITTSTPAAVTAIIADAARLTATLTAAQHTPSHLAALHHLIAVHRWGWNLTLNADGTTTATSPDGIRTLHSHGPPGTAAA
jgi:DNA invertase Pin-like site-specific DNA recombinase